MTNLNVCGPFDIDCYIAKRGGKRLLEEYSTKSGLKNSHFATTINSTIAQMGYAELNYLRGNYVFGLRAGKGFTPYYVGKALKSGLLIEAMNSRNRLQYNKCISNYKGTPVMFFLLPPIRKGKDNLRVLSEAEKFLIEIAYLKTGDYLINKQHAKIPKWGINGVIRSEKGRSTLASRKFKSMMGFNK